LPILVLQQDLIEIQFQMAENQVVLKNFCYREDVAEVDFL
jgi:hypothetical protein